MKRILYILLLSAIVGSCSKDAIIDNSIYESLPLSFSIDDDLTRAASSPKSSWSTNDLLAIFEQDNETSKCYYVKSADNATFTLTQYDSMDYFEASTSDKTYIAYYPYKSDYSLTDYQQGYIDKDLLVSKITVVGGSLTSTTDVVTFSNFEHVNCYINFNFTPGTEYTVFTSIVLKLRNGATTLWDYTLTAEEVAAASHSRYSLSPDSSSSQTLYMVANGDDDAYTFEFDADTFVGGTEYTINLTIGTPSD